MPGIKINNVSLSANRILLNYELDSQISDEERKELEAYQRELELKRSGKVNW